MAEDVDDSETAEYIMTDFISRSLRSEDYQWDDPSTVQDVIQSKISRQLIEIADDFAKQRESTMENLSFTDSFYSSFKTIAKDLFDDGINRGRVLALFHFGGSLASRAVPGAGSTRFDSLITRIISECLVPWFFQKGKWIKQAMLLLLSMLLSVSFGGRTRLKHGIGTTTKVTKLILWVCGDVELNPGPGNSRSEILRRFRKSQQSSILIMLYKQYDHSSVSTALYKEVPIWWPKGTPFVNITNRKRKEGMRPITEEECITCFNKSIELLNDSVSDLSPDWVVILRHYNDLLNKCGDNTHLEHCKDKLIEWMGSKRIQKALETVDTKSFMDDLRLKLRVLGDLANQGEVIPDDIAEEISAVNLSINRSKRKRKEESAFNNTSTSTKRQRSNNSNSPSQASSDTLPSADLISLQGKVAEQSEASEIGTFLTSSQSSCANDLSVTISSTETSGQSTSLPIIATLGNIGSHENNDIQSDVKSSNFNMEIFVHDDNTLSGLQLPSDVLNISLNETDENDIIDTFNIDFLELSEEELGAEV
ncbi:hypothetical protein FSP39_015429 [Pinctada imbricata]|uniref:Bcl-2 Bcl-2 homology region 1-3 domain-containing protein n=1 Tax=Pinctada imbricata TaxID=66713 RepID=A0AA89C6M3_PINIB|nr:hypothetical protein FSP39_015429 [Pinctada imbricata]